MKTDRMYELARANQGMTWNTYPSQHDTHVAFGNI